MHPFTIIGQEQGEPVDSGLTGRREVKRLVTAPTDLIARSFTDSVTFFATIKAQIVISGQSFLPKKRDKASRFC